MNNWSVWTLKRSKFVKAKWNEGVGDAEIAALLGPPFTARSIRTQRWRLGAVVPRGCKRNPWTLKTIDRLKQLWIEGGSSDAIATSLSIETGYRFTRNAVIGKVHRLGLSGRPSSTPKSRPIRPRPTTVPKHSTRTRKAPGASTGGTAQTLPEPQPVVPIEIPCGERCTILMLTERTCRWPIGNIREPDFHFCGALPKSGRPYCALHSRISYQSINTHMEAAE